MKPKGKDWRKCPSVTYGGKTHFWVRFINNMKQTIVWNRINQEWVYLIEYNTYAMENGL